MNKKKPIVVKAEMVVYLELRCKLLTLINA